MYRPKNFAFVLIAALMVLVTVSVGQLYGARFPVRTLGDQLAPLNNPGVGGPFGQAIAVDGNGRVLVGVSADSSDGPASGIAYLLDSNSGNVIRTITNPQPAANDYFGNAVAITADGDLLIAALGDDTGSTDAGAVYRFDGQTGALLATLLNPFPQSGDGFGAALAALPDGDVLVGAYRDSLDSDSGGAVYRFDGVSGQMMLSIANPAPMPFDHFGRSVAAMPDGRVVVGSHRTDTLRLNEGVVYVFDGVTGDLQLSIENPDAGVNDQFGYSVATTSNGQILVGAYKSDSGAVSSGIAYLFDGSNGNLLLTLNNPDPDTGDYFGYAVAVTADDQLVVGAYGDSTNASRSGVVYVFDQITGELLTTVNNPQPADNDYFGIALAAFDISDVLIGSVGADAGDGVIYRSFTANAPPQITSTAVLTSAVGDEYSYDVEAFDPDLDPLIYSLIAAPAGMTIDPDSGLVEWSPQQSGVVDVTVEVADPMGASDSQPFQIDVSADTTPPSITVIEPGQGILTNQNTVDVSGTLSEPADLLVNGETVVVDDALEFSHPVTLVEGSNDIALQATDEAGNIGQAQVSVVLDSTPPDAPNPVRLNRGNASGGQVMVVGDTGAVESGGLVHLINLTTFVEETTLADGDGSFSGTIAAQASDSISLFVVDAAGNQSASTVLVPNPPETLTLNPIGDRTAPIGEVTSFNVTASDSSDSVVTLAIAPLPLPDGAEFNIATGEFTYQPNVSQVGDLSLTFFARTENEEVSETITVTVPEPVQNAPTVMRGRILDANSMNGDELVPIAGATVSFLNTPAAAITDAQGFFELPDVPVEAEVFDIDANTAQMSPDGGPYASFREALSLQPGVVNQFNRPFYLPRLAVESLTTVDPQTITMVVNPTLGVALEVPPNTALNADGTEFTGDLSISLVPRDLAPAALPEGLDPDMLVTIQPVGVTFATPVPITFPNTDELEPGSEVDIWSIDPDLGQFIVVGVGQVSDDGQRIETIQGGIIAADWHAPLPPDPDPDPDNPQDPDNPEPDCPSAPGASSFCLHDGHMSVEFTLPEYRSLEAYRTLKFNYRTFRADPRPAIEFGGVIRRRSAVPRVMSFEVDVAGIQQGQQTYVSTAGFSEGQDERFAISLAFDGTDFQSGMYPYRIKATSHFRSSRASAFISGEVMVINEQQSPFGVGWMLEELYRLEFGSGGNVLLIAPNGRSIHYRRDPSTGAYDAPDNDYAVFERNSDGSYTHTEKTGIRMHFDARGLLTAHEDRNNNLTNYIYDAADRLIRIIDPVGLETVFDYDTAGRLRTVTDPANRVSTFSHDVNGNLIRITYPDGTFEDFEYNGRHLMTAHEDERGNRFTDRYDAFGRIIDGILPDGTVIAATGKTASALVDVSSGFGTVINPAPVVRPEEIGADYVDGRGNPSSMALDPHGRYLLHVDEIGRITRFIRDADSNPIQITRPNGSVVTRTFDSLGNILTEREEFNGAMARYSYGDFSLVTELTNPNNHTTRVNRDERGNPIEIINHLGHTTTRQYDSRGLITRIVEPNGLQTEYLFNARGLVERIVETPPANSPGNVRTTELSYDPVGLVSQVITPDGITLNFSYDERSRPILMRDNLNQEVRITYDEYGNVIEIDALNEDGGLALNWLSVFDNRNRLVEMSRPHQQGTFSTVRYLLDNNSNKVGTIDPNGNSSSYQYDPANRMTEFTHRLNGVASFTYDELNRITQVIGPNGVSTQYEYDLIGRLTREISPDRGNSSFEYDLANNLTLVTDGRGVQTAYSYDGLERPTNKVLPNNVPGKNENVTYIFDNCAFGIGRLCSRIDESGRYDYQYDAYGNLVQQDFAEAGGVSYSTSYVYDDGDNIIQTIYPSGRAVVYTRDGVRRVSDIQAIVNGAPSSIVSDIQYRIDQRMTQCVYGNGLVDQRQYDLQGRLIRQQLTNSSAAIIDERDYLYDRNSNLLSRVTTPQTSEYGYDALDRLVSDSVDGGMPTGYEYDQSANRQLQSSLATLTEEIYSFFDGSNRLRLTQTLRQGNDPLPPVAERQMIYNDVGRLYQLIENGELLAEYIYNDDGQRIRKTVYNSGIVESITVFHYDNMGYLISETTENGAPVRDYIWTESMTPVAQIDHDSGIDAVSYLHTDHLMTNRLATDDAQQVVWRWEGQAFGDTQPQELTELRVNLRFPGQYVDTESGLHYNRFRYYDPSLGRYITSDPIGLADGPNTYLYAGANPIAFYDPTGLSKLPNDPSGLGDEWVKDPSHRYPHGERFRNPNGDFVDWHPARPGKSPKTWGGKDHWHVNGGDKHYPPGSDAPDFPEPAPQPAPQPSPEPSPNENPGSDGPSGVCPPGSTCRTVGTGVAAGATAYVIYRCIRMLPSLAPPLWPTIPANAAIP